MQPMRLPQSILFILILSFLMLPVEQVDAASITVDENCSLSDAIVAANTDAAVGGCAAGSGADAIALTMNITLAAALPPIAADVAIEGNSYSISGNDAYGIFAVNGSSLTINNLTITDGFSSTAGGGISVLHGSLTLSNSTIQGASARDAGGGIYANDSRVEIIGSEIKGNSAGAGGGGGLYFSSSYGTQTLDITDTAFTRNTSTQAGGALRIARGTVTIKRSSFSFNEGDEGGAIENTNGTLRIENSTFNNNEARLGGGLSLFGSEVTLTHTTWAHNSAAEKGGAIYLVGWTGTLKLRNTLVAGNAGGDCDSGLNPFSITENVGSFIQDGSCSPTRTGDPLLDEAVGSPAYFPLQAGSPAIDSADDSYCPPVDQLGTSRPQGAACEIGAYEAPADLLPEATPEVTPESPPEATPEVTPEPTSQPTPQPSPEPTPQPTPQPTPDDACLHTVAASQNLFRLAIFYDTTVEDFLRLNDLDTDLIRVGQVLSIPNCGDSEPVSVCPNLTETIVVDVNTAEQYGAVLCRQVPTDEIDRPPGLADFVHAVYVWGDMSGGVEVCFRDGGSLVFLDAASSPPEIFSLPSSSQAGMTCGRIDRVGTVVLVASDP